MSLPSTLCYTFVVNDEIQPYIKYVLLTIVAKGNSNQTVNNAHARRATYKKKKKKKK
jgi:hypothetical protein